MAPEIQSGMLSNQDALVKIAQDQSANSKQLYGLTEPGLKSAENFYGDLSTGDPNQIARAIAPATQQITQATEGAKKNILENSPAGGERNLALEQADVNRGAQVGNLASSGYIKSFDALSQLAGQGVGESISAAGTGISGFNSANSGLASLGQLQLQDHQQQMEAKGASLGALGQLGGAAAGAAGGALGGGGWEGALAALAL